MQKWVIAELKRLDCGCGCKGEKAFKKKYGSLVGGKILKDCPPGFRNDGLTCVSSCNPDEHDDPLSCRKKCAPGQIDDGWTCRNPIQSSMNSCPDGSRDIAGTCWGPKHKWCVDDCFKHPAPGCRTWECGRLNWLGVDWGPKLCTDCNLRCGETCWWTDGITKQLHERDLRIWGGEVNGQAIRFKTVEGRVDFAELGNAMKAGLEDLFSADGALAKLFDPEKNGVAAAMRKFGNDMKAILEEVGNRIKDGFEKMGAAAKAAFEEMARNAERDFKAFGDEFVKMMKDPMFWAEVIGVFAMVAGAALSIALTTVTLGIGAPAAVGLMAACAMAGPAAKMIAKAATGQPIDALDIANLAISGASAMVPGLSGIVQTAVKVGTTAASVVISGVQAGQALQIIPSTCIANCPGPIPDIEVPKLDDPKFPRDPPPAGQKTDEEILNTVVPRSRFIFSLRDPRRENPDYIGMTELEYIAKYRRENYNADGTPIAPGNQIVSPEDKAIEAATEVIVPDEPPLDAGDLETPNPVEGEFDELPGFEEMPEDGFDELPGFEEMPSDGFDELPGFEPMPEDEQTVNVPVMQGGAEFQVVESGDLLSNFWGSNQAKARSNIPKTQSGAEFNPNCYAQHNPEIAKSVDNDMGKLTTHWLEKGHKDKLNAECAGWEEAKRQREIEDLAIQKELARIESQKTICATTDRFWNAVQNKCDGTRHADGRINTASRECTKFDNYWDTSGTKSICNRERKADGTVKSRKDNCLSLGSYWDDHPNYRCHSLQNPDGSLKSKPDLCTSLLDGFWDDSKKECNYSKDRDGNEITYEGRCIKANGFLKPYPGVPGINVCDTNLDINGNPKQYGEQSFVYAFDTKKATEYIDFQLNEMAKLPGRLFPNPNLNNEARSDVREQPTGSGRSGKSLTLYHAEWCHFCTKLMPTWKKLGSEYKGIKIVTIEEKQNKSFPVDGYPTIVYRDGSTMEKYEGKRTKAAIVNFLKSKL